MDYPARFEWQTRCEFNAYCKRTLRNELIDACRERKSRKRHEVSFADLTPHEEKQLYTVDRYFANEAQIAADARQKSMPFFLISFFSLTMSVFIIYSSYKVITLDRLPVIGTFRSISATQKAVTRILLLESGLYGILGGLIGIPVGTLVLKLILQGMGQSLSQGIEIPIVISPFSIIFSFAVAVVVSLLSAWMPVRRASRLPIKDVVLGSVEEKQVPRRFILAAGVALFVVSIILPKLASGICCIWLAGFPCWG